MRVLNMGSILRACMRGDGAAPANEPPQPAQSAQELEEPATVRQQLRQFVYNVYEYRDTRSVSITNLALALD